MVTRTVINQVFSYGGNIHYAMAAAQAGRQGASVNDVRGLVPNGTATTIWSRSEVTYEASQGLGSHNVTEDEEIGTYTGGTTAAVVPPTTPGAVLGTLSGQLASPNPVIGGKWHITFGANLSVTQLEFSNYAHYEILVNGVSRGHVSAVNGDVEFGQHAPSGGIWSFKINASSLTDSTLPAAGDTVEVRGSN